MIQLASETQPSLDLRKFGLLRPLKIRWMLNQTDEDFFQSLKSETLQHFLKKSDEILKLHQISVKQLWLDQKMYVDWHLHYVQTMQNKGYDVIASPEWFAQKKQEGKNVGGFFFSQNEQWVGTLIYSQKGQEKVFAAYKTNLEVPGLGKKHQSLGAIIDYYFIREMRERKIPWISLGSMRNAFGVINTLGNLDYKLRFGYLPTIDLDTQLVPTAPLNEQRAVCFFGMKNEELGLYFVGPDTPQRDALRRFQNAIMPIHTLIT